MVNSETVALLVEVLREVCRRGQRHLPNYAIVDKQMARG
jgi:hypothetical protein